MNETMRQAMRQVDRARLPLDVRGEAAPELILEATAEFEAAYRMGGELVGPPCSECGRSLGVARYLAAEHYGSASPTASVFFRQPDDHCSGPQAVNVCYHHDCSNYPGGLIIWVRIQLDTRVP